MRLLYAGCLRAMRCLPEDIIGVAYGLRYKTPDDHPCGLYDWTEEFCESLHQLVVHPFWGGSMAPLALFLQYTVVLDTHDTRPWGAIPSRTHGQDAFVDNVLLESQFARIPLWEARARCAAQDFAEAAPANRLYDLLEYTIHEHYQEHPATRPEPRDDAYLVENRTLRILLEALDDISQIHVVAFVPSHSLAMSARLAGSANNFPRSDDWPEVREHCLLRDIEERMQAAKSLG
ncbi:hypothetical protein QBC39DRAFT_318153 [Podospora conica]|nr:hypothetical protein QBC39DRAFT_318153 [Schizothecium conicum]